MLKKDTPALDQVSKYKSDYGLENHGLFNLGIEYWNLPREALYEEAIYRGEGYLVEGGAFLAYSGKHTARAAKDKYTVLEDTTKDHIWWENNTAITPDLFDTMHTRVAAYLQEKDVFVQDVFVGVDEDYQLPIRVVTERAWHSLFTRNMFIKPELEDEYANHVPEFTIIQVPSFMARGEEDGLRSSTFIMVNFAKKLALVGDSGYGGEIKKTIFSVMNYLLPLKGVVTMHCSANKGEAEDDVALFFGLSGTGKTTLSADITRGLIGDDEHGWSENGIFNFEDGCYAKVIRLSPEAEPQIYAATHRYGTILENVIHDPVTRKIDLNDDTITENTRASYPLTYIDNAVPEKKAGHPKNIILLTCDAQGVMPPIAKLSPDQALYHFISGYTSKVGGTETGLGKEPQMTFSACFGAPFMMHHPAVYADLLKEKILEHDVNCWLLNTGWVGGSYGIGERISIKYTRAILRAALNGDLLNVDYQTDPVFGYQVPLQCPGVPENILHPADAWDDKEKFMQKYRQLAAKFIESFKKFEDKSSPEVCAASPKID
ncbi:MAG: phosphoenolpyruvate carboxykinase (ATP) [Anaerolineales bacterium]|nr:phosphoenolpyruvate carboxykinase (ATP) [Anaerolineales bacterium]